MVLIDRGSSLTGVSKPSSDLAGLLILASSTDEHASWNAELHSASDGNDAPATTDADARSSQCSVVNSTVGNAFRSLRAVASSSDVRVPSKPDGSAVHDGSSLWRSPYDSLVAESRLVI